MSKFLSYSFMFFFLFIIWWTWFIMWYQYHRIIHLNNFIDSNKNITNDNIISDNIADLNDDAIYKVKKDFIDKTEWKLQDWNLWVNTWWTLSFDNWKIYSKFCNNVSHWYNIKDNKIIVTWLWMSTMMYCEWLPMTLEDNFKPKEDTIFNIDWNILTIIINDWNVFTFEKILK